MPDHKLAFIGLGVMGYPMAGHLARAGHAVRVYNRTVAKAERWVGEHGGEVSATAAAAADGADFVFACVGNDDDLRSVTVGDACAGHRSGSGAFASMKKGAVFTDHTTASATVARELSAAATARGFSFVDAPVSGGQAGAEDGVLTVMAGGDAESFARAKPLMEHYAKAVTLMGASGAGQLTKMVNQICIAGLVQGLSEGVAFAVNAGLDARQVFEVIGGGAAQSWQMVNRYETMLDNEFEFGFAVDWMRKDLALCFDEAIKNNSDLPIAKIVDDFYAEIQAAGGNRYDTSSLVTRLRRADLEK